MPNNPRIGHRRLTSQRISAVRDVIRIIRDAQHVTASRIDERRGPGKPFNLNQVAAERAKSLLTDRKTYLDGTDECVLDPGVELVFTDADRDAVTILICFHCGDISVQRAGQQVGEAHFDTGEMKLLDLALSIFPRDKDLRALKEEEIKQRSAAAGSPQH